MITGTSERNILTKHILCKSECKFDGRKCNSNQKWNSLFIYLFIYFQFI